MCRDNNHGGRRCPNDTSEARRHRRRLAEARKSNTTVTPVSSTFDPTDSDLPTLATLEDMKQESETLNLLLHTPELEDQEKQDKLDDLLEKRVRNLGAALGSLADGRAQFDLEKYTAERDLTPSSFTEALAAEEAAQEEVRRTADIYETFPYYKQWSKNKAGATGSDSLREQWSTELDEANDNNYEAVEHFTAMEVIADAERRKERSRREVFDSKTAEALSSAYRQVIADMRSVGGEIRVTEKASNPETIKKLEETVGQHYPSAWLKTSSSFNEIRVKGQFGARAHYGHDLDQPEEDGEIRDKEVLLLLFSDSDLSKLRESPGSVKDLKGRPFKAELGTTKVYSISVRVPFDSQLSEAAPDGSPLDKTNFHYGYTVNEKYTGLSDTKGWYSISTHKTATGSEILMDTESSDSTYYHEFAHRAEYVVPNNAITRQEEAFLRRRTTNTQDNIREELSFIYAPASSNISEIEVGRRDNFLHHYMGKEYLSSNSREVLSMGAEAIFAGKFGALAGVRNDLYDQADLDYRAFVLGIFAAA